MITRRFPPKFRQFGRDWSRRPAPIASPRGASFAAFASLHGPVPACSVFLLPRMLLFSPLTDWEWQILASLHLSLASLCGRPDFMFLCWCLRYIRRISAAFAVALAFITRGNARACARLRTCVCAKYNFASVSSPFPLLPPFPLAFTIPRAQLFVCVCS